MAHKLTRDEYDELDYHYGNAPDVSEEFASVEHFVLTANLNKLGYYPHGREEAMEIASRLLAQGWR